MPSPPLPATVGRYRILDELGRGAMGRVYRAHDPHTDRTVALKVLDALDDRPQEAATELRARFLREARAAGRLAHPGIVAVYDADVDAATGTPFLAMELVDGRSLAEMLAQRGVLPWREATAIATAVADALDHAHERGVVHRDLKPANVLLAADGSVKVSDFGVARLVDDSSTFAGTLRGTPSYMAPEQIRGQSVDGRADLYALGTVVYEMLTGEPPFRADTVVGVAHQAVHDAPRSPSFASPDLPLALESVVLRAMAKTPAERFANGREMAAALRAVADPEAPFAAPPDVPPPPPEAPPSAVEVAPVVDTRPASTPLPRPAPAARRRWRSPAALALAAVGAVLAGAFASFLWLGPTDGAPNRAITLPSPPPQASAPAPPLLVAPAAVEATPAPEPTAEAQPVPPAPRATAARPATPPQAAPAEPVPVGAQPAPAGEPLAPAGAATAAAGAAPAPAETATIELHFVNRIKEGTLSLLLDGQLAWSTPLESSKNPLRRLGGEELIGSIAVSAGAHDVEVRVANASARIDAREVIGVELSAGETRRLRIVLLPLRGRLKVKWEP